MSMNGSLETPSPLAGLGNGGIKDEQLLRRNGNDIEGVDRTALGQGWEHDGGSPYELDGADFTHEVEGGAGYEYQIKWQHLRSENGDGTLGMDFGGGDSGFDYISQNGNKTSGDNHFDITRIGLTSGGGDGRYATGRFFLTHRQLPDDNIAVVYGGSGAYAKIGEDVIVSGVVDTPSHPDYLRFFVGDSSNYGSIQITGRVEIWRRPA
jgi:hypothetical protein